MADVEPKQESLMEKIAEKIHPHHDGDDSSSSSSSSDSDSDKPSAPAHSSIPPAAAGSGSGSGSGSFDDNVKRLFGRQKPIHSVLGGGKSADVLLWRNKKISGGVLGVATTVWVLFELVEYHLLSLVCHCLILALALVFLWSNASVFINKSAPRIPEINLSEDAVVNAALTLRSEINRALHVLREIALGHNLKKFLAVIAGVWMLSVVGSWCNFLTLLYIAFVLLYTVPVLYEKYEDKVDPLAEKAIAECNKQYAVFDEKVLRKIPLGPLKTNKQA